MARQAEAVAPRWWVFQLHSRAAIGGVGPGRGGAAVGRALDAVVAKGVPAVKLVELGGGAQSSLVGKVSSRKVICQILLKAKYMDPWGSTIYVYTYIYTHVYIQVYTYVYISIYIYTYKYIYIYICIYTYLYIYIYTCVYIYTSYVYIYIYIHRLWPRAARTSP